MKDLILGVAWNLIFAALKMFLTRSQTLEFTLGKITKHRNSLSINVHAAAPLINYWLRNIIKVLFRHYIVPTKWTSNIAAFVVLIYDKNFRKLHFHTLLQRKYTQLIISDSNCCSFYKENFIYKSFLGLAHVSRFLSRRQLRFPKKLFTIRKVEESCTSVRAEIAMSSLFWNVSNREKRNVIGLTHTEE